MGKVTNLLYGTFSEVQQDGSLLLNYDFIMNIFEPLYAQLPELEDYLNYYNEDKMGNTNSSCNEKERIRVIDEAMTELFWP